MLPDRQTVIKLLDKFNPEKSHSLAERLLEGVTPTEADAWFLHPCTQSLIASLDGDVSGISLMLISGAYADESSVDATAQKTAKAIGMAQAIQEMIDHIAEIRRTKIEERHDAG